MKSRTQFPLHKYFTFLILALCITAFLAFASGFPAGAKTNAELQKDIDALKSRINSINKDQSTLKAQIAAAQSSAKTLSEEITELNAEVDLIDEQVIVISSLIDQFDILTAEQETQIADLEVQIASEQKMLDDMIRLSFEYGGTGSSVEFIFSAEDFGDLLSRIDLLSYHLSYNNKVLEKYNSSLENLEKTKAEYEAAKITMNEYKAEQEKLRAELEVKQAEAERKRAQALENAEAYEAELNEKQKYINQLDEEIKALAAMFAKETPDEKPYSGTFAFPLPRGVYTITSYYGNRKDPFTGKTSYHNGYDLACAKGTEIYAADDGTVVIAKANGGYGNCVTINHGGGIMTLYGHCSSLAVVSGQQVKRGDVIAYVGSTGRSTGNHLHFTVYKNGVLADPGPYIGLS